MDAERFDALSRLIGSRTSRRGAVGLAAAGLLTVAVPDVAEARCSSRKPRSACKRCRRHRCKSDATQNDTLCTTEKTCQAGVCACPSGKADCNGDGICEVTLATDPNNCGMCGRVCQSTNGTAHCTGNACELLFCDPGFHDCDGNGNCESEAPCS